MVDKMRHSWREIEVAIQRLEDRRAVSRQTIRSLGDTELGRSYRRGIRLTRYAGYAATMVIGFNIGVVTLILNYSLFNIILHLNLS